MQSTKKTFRLSAEAIATLEKICKEKNMNQTALIEEMILTYSPEHNKTAHQVSSEIKEYLDEANKAKNERDYYKRELERYKTEVSFKNDQINLFANNNKQKKDD